METQLVIFLAFTSVTVVTNTLLIVFAYRAVANLTTKVTEAAREFETSQRTRSFITSLHSASETARELSDRAKERVQGCDPVLARTQDQYGFMLAQADKKLSDLGEKLTENARRMRDAVEGPAATICAFAAGLRTVVGPMNGSDEE
ncbi:MAG: hypothetical protein HY646_18970 [Acidobacteria bacterium]|nr:hypothetical protein [Acidobacteriota bacterium]